MTKAPGTTQSQGRRYWQAHVTAQQESGLTRAAYCRRHELSYHALTYWQNKLSKASRQQGQLVQVPLQKILPIRSEGSSGVSIVLDNRITITLAEQFSPETLGKVLAVLEKR